MTQKPDTTKIEAALKRAAYKALHGTREERSGRFQPSEERRASHSDQRHSTKDLREAKRKG